MALMYVLAALAVAPSVAGRRPVREFTINLDLPPEERFVKGTGLLQVFNNTVWKFYDEYFSKDPEVRDALYTLVLKRGNEPLEMQLEIDGLAKASGLPLLFVQGVQMLYELQTTMVPIVNSSTPKWPKGLEALSRIPWRGPGCTGIIAKCADGAVYHARNLDFAPVDIMTNLVYTGIFTKGGQEVFRSQMIAGYQQIITAYRSGPDGYAIERNTRYPDATKGDAVMMHNVLSGKTLNGWTLRKIIETTPNYESAVSQIADAAYCSTEYAIISGNGKGTILSKNGDEPGTPPVAHTQTLGQPNFEEPDNYIIVTNFDFWDHDLREYFDTTGGEGIGHPRRIEAQKMLNATTPLTPEFLFETINAKGVLADTIFQAVISVQKNYWNVSCPDLK